MHPRKKVECFRECESTTTIRHPAPSNWSKEQAVFTLINKNTAPEKRMHVGIPIPVKWHTSSFPQIITTQPVFSVKCA
jgi:hypothetical protein